MGTLPVIIVQHMAGGPDSPLLVLGPSLGTSFTRLWGPVVRKLQGWNVVGWDLPGHGASPGIDRIAAGFGMADLAAAVMNAVDDAVDQPRKSVYAGVSVGGAVGLQLALDRPERLHALAVVCSAGAFGEPSAWNDRATLVRSKGMAPMLRAAPDRWFGSRIRSASDGRIALALADLGDVEPEGYARVCNALSKFDIRDQLAGLTVPLLAIAGREDVATPPAVVADIADLASGRLEVIEGVGHLAPFEDPYATSVRLRDFLADSHP